RRATLLDRDSRIGGTWARRYDRLRLHTVRRFSGLPGRPLPDDLPRYVPKDRYADYLADYARAFELDVRLGHFVTRIERDGDGWLVVTADGASRTRALVIATGRHNEPRVPDWPGRESFRGRLLHAHDYRSGASFAGQRVLVVGIGNSGAEIAADLVEQGAAHVAVAVRRVPPIGSREVIGIPVQLLGIAMKPFPPRLVDRLGAILRRIGTGDLRRYGLGEPAWGPFVARRPPVIESGLWRSSRRAGSRSCPTSRASPMAGSN
ncbi:MAG: NAD(P)/FAD-dependent oxidoreductase, partial [Thermomicrobiales bacterium]|nr:NAD(P)/FAD-dependent oxidoreductase [Thermomicrobiales bacterium]